MAIVSTFCKKGGVGKSTFIGFMAHYYASLGNKVLIISTDDQNSIFKIFGIFSHADKLSYQGQS